MFIQGIRVDVERRGKRFRCAIERVGEGVKLKRGLLTR